MKIFLFLIILVSVSWSKAKQEVEVPINLGIGPTFFWIPGVMNRELHTGAKLDLYAVVSPKMLEEHKNKIPKKFRKYVNMEEEMHLSQVWTVIIPQYLIISPSAQSHAYGGLWSFINISMPFVKNKVVELEGMAVLPTIFYIYTHARENAPDGQHLLGFGGMLRIENTIRFSDNFLATLAYGHNFNIPLPPIFDGFPTNTYQREGKSTEQRWTQTGILSLVFHFRFLSIKQKV